MRLLRLLLGVMIFIAGSCVTANACQCLLQAPACADYWRADAVFVGSVTNIAPSFDDLEAQYADEESKGGAYSRKSLSRIDRLSR